MCVGGGSLESPTEQRTEPNRRQKETWGHKASRKKGQFEVTQSDDNGAENILLMGRGVSQATGYDPWIGQAVSILVNKNDVLTLLHNTAVYVLEQRPFVDLIQATGTRLGE